MDSLEFQLQGIVTQPIRSSTKKRPLSSPKIGSSPSLSHSKNQAHHNDIAMLKTSSPMMMRQEPLNPSHQDDISSHEMHPNEAMTPKWNRMEIPESPPHSITGRTMELQDLTSGHRYLMANDIQSPPIERLQQPSRLDDNPTLTSPSLLAERLILPSSTKTTVSEDFEHVKKVRPIKAISGGWVDKLQKSLARHRANQNFKKLDPSVAQELPADWECIAIHAILMDEGLLKCICLVREEDHLIPSRWFILLSSMDHFRGVLPPSPFKLIISDPWLKTKGEPYWVFASHIALSVMTQSLDVPPSNYLTSLLSPHISRRSTSNRHP